MKTERIKSRLSDLYVGLFALALLLAPLHLGAAESTNTTDNTAKTNNGAIQGSDAEGSRPSQKPFYKELILVLFGTGGAGVLLVRALLKSLETKAKAKQAKLAEQEIEKKIKIS